MASLQDVNQHITKGIILDLDGVIVDTEPLWCEALIKTFDAVGIKITVEDCQKTRGLFYKKVVEMWCNKCNLEKKLVKNISSKLLQCVISLIKARNVLAPDFDKFIKEVKLMGLKLGLATSSPKELLEVIFDKYEIRDYFDSWTTGDEIRNFKPHPEIYIKQAKKMGLSPFQVIAIEDSIPGMVSAYAAGCKIIAMPSPENKFRREYGLAHFIAYSFSDITPEVIKIISD